MGKEKETQMVLSVDACMQQKGYGDIIREGV